MLQFTKYFILLFLFTATGSFAQNTAINTGINTKNPGSRLTVNGSFAGNYKIITENAVLGFTDYFTAYNGNADGTVHLPPAGSGSLKGRVYIIKNNSNYNLTVIPSGQEQIRNYNTLLVAPGYSAKLISEGTITGITWAVITMTDTKVKPKNIKKALDYSFGMDRGAYPIPPTAFTVPDSNPVLVPESQTMFTTSVGVLTPVFINVAVGLADLTSPKVFSKSPYYRCELYINGRLYDTQIIQQQYVGSSLQFNLSDVFYVYPSSNSNSIQLKITRWNDDGHTGAQQFMVLSVVYDGVYLLRQ
ncbi:hypothetical protein [Flavobacterium sp. 38-13]|uniref:hypothetical protein n=1 Tax=Flavobacterium sp. 38-13 TaxID=1896168 RepID=UPI000AA69E31|nr:hypothetical protein [Flavobacterium sp. 38-13]